MNTVQLERLTDGYMGLHKDLDCSREFLSHFIGHRIFTVMTVEDIVACQPSAKNMAFLHHALKMDSVGFDVFYDALKCTLQFALADLLKPELAPSRNPPADRAVRVCHMCNGSGELIIAEHGRVQSSMRSEASTTTESGAQTSSFLVIADSSAADYSDDSDISDVEGGGSFSSVMSQTEYNQNISLRLVPTTFPRIRKLYKNTDKVYRTTDPVRGRILIINNMTFLNDVFPKRFGSDIDYQNIRRLFKDMKFEIVKTEQELTDLTAEQIYKEIGEETRNVRHAELGMFVLVLMSYGTRGEIIFGSDNQPVDLVRVKDLLSATKFPAMRGKPKLVIAQACSGERTDLGNIVVSQPPNISALLVSANPGPPVATLNVDDFFVMRPSSESYVAARSTTHGSWFVRILVSTFYRHACHRDLEELFKIIQFRVRRYSISHSERSARGLYDNPVGGNVPVSQCTFTNLRKLYFFPGFPIL